MVETGESDVCPGPPSRDASVQAGVPSSVHLLTPAQSPQSLQWRTGVSHAAAPGSCMEAGPGG